jgi:chromosome segregation ATPase
MDQGELVLGSALAILSGVVWLVRLEGRINQVESSNIETQKDVDDLRLKHESLDERLVNKLSEIERALARIEGRLGHDGLGPRG